jgi:hypothetical protein
LAISSAKRWRPGSGTYTSAAVWNTTTVASVGASATTGPTSSQQVTADHLRRIGLGDLHGGLQPAAILLGVDHEHASGHEH